jgi:glycosyltransferase involved in cell wall biosynthesis
LSEHVFGGTPEIIVDKVTGLVVNPNNIQMLSEALYSILENKEYATKLGKAGSERVKKLFTMERYVTETLEWYLK